MSKNSLVFISVLFSMLLAGCSDSGPIEQTLEEVQAINDRTSPAGSVKTEASAAAPAKTVSTPVASSEAKSGKDVYTAACFACHGTGAAGAPKLGDKAAWEPRIAQGMEILQDHAIKGFKGMPPKGGNMSLSDDEVRSSIEYIVSESK